MGEIADKANLAWRDKVDGTPSSGDHRPTKADIRDVMATVDAKVESIEAGNGMGLISFATTAERTAFVHRAGVPPLGTKGVTAQDLQDGNVYRSSGSAWVLIGPSPANALATAQADIVALDGRLDDAETDIAALQAADTAFDTRVDAVEAAAAATHAEAVADPSVSEIASMWSAVVAGNPAVRAAISTGDIVTTALDGRMIRVTGAAVRAPAAAYRLLAGHKYEVLAGARRITDPTDPSGDSVSLRAEWLSGTKGHIDQVSLEDHDLVSTDGLHLYRAIVAAASGDEVDIVAPGGTVYFTPLVRTWGTDGVTDILPLVRVTDLTSNTLLSADTAGMNARIAALESLDIGDRLTALEAGIIASVRTLMTTDPTFFVRALDGDDANTGLGLVDAAGEAFQSIPGAIAKIAAAVDFGGHGGALKLGDGSYTLGAELFEPFVGHNAREPFQIIGNLTDETLVRLDITNGTAIRLRQANISLDGVTIKVVGGGYGIVGDGHSVITLGDIRLEDVTKEMLSFNTGAQLAAIPGKTMTVAGNAESWIHYTHGAIVSLEDYNVVFEDDPEFSVYLAGGNGPGSQLTVNRTNITGNKSGRLVIHFGAVLNHAPESGHIFSTFFQETQTPNQIDNGGAVYYDPPYDTAFINRLTGDDRHDGYAADRPFPNFNAATNYFSRRPKDQAHALIPTHQCAADTYPGGFTLPTIVGCQVAILRGNPEDPASCTISTTGAHCIESIATGTYWIVDGFRFESTLSGLLSLLEGTRVGFRNCLFGDAGGDGQIIVQQGAYLESLGPNSVDGDAAALLYTGGGEVKITHDMTFVGDRTYTQLVYGRRRARIRWDGLKIVEDTITGNAVDLADGAYCEQGSNTIPGDRVPGDVDAGSFALLV